jgi:CO/xanthine dehydrogenase Mo-binding subunit
VSDTHRPGTPQVSASCYTDEIHWNGQPVAVVVAETIDIARHAASLVHVGYDEWPATVAFDAALGHAEKQPRNPSFRPTPKRVMPRPRLRRPGLRSTCA